MIDPNYINNIMSELGLNPADEKARKVIERLVSSKPQVPISASFISQLRDELQQQSNAYGAQPSLIRANSFTALFVNKILASALVVMIVVAAGGFWYIQHHTDKPLFQTPQERAANEVLSGKYSVSSVAEESFGDLNKVSIVAAKDANTSKSLAQNTNTPTSMAMPDKMIAPGEPYPLPSEYSFKYIGGNLPALSDSQGVLKRTQIKQPASLVDRIVAMLSFGLVDLTKFHDVQIQSFSFVEDHDYGYNVNVDMVNGNVGIYQNWDKWPQPPVQTMMCVKDSPSCNPNPGIKPEDVPADDDLFKETDQFLADYGISREAYGQPAVVNSWRIMYKNLPETQRATFVIPEQMQVVYPLMLEGQQVYNESGQPSGMSLVYDIRQRKVISVDNLSTKQFEKSNYVGVTDKTKIMDYATHGGFRNYINPLAYSADQPQTSQGTKTTELQLETPSVRMVQLWYADPNQPNQQNGELYVPALVFPIKDWQSTGYWRPNVIVPLVKAIFDSDYQGQSPKPMPMMENSSSGSAIAPQSAPADTPKEQK